jgi:hypothetical protein
MDNSNTVIWRNRDIKEILNDFRNREIARIKKYTELKKEYNKLKEERRIMQYNYIRTIGHKKLPNFIKSKVSNRTERKFHSLSGNFFGVAC